MTFKHTKFEESPTMRSLEKLAHEKGLIKNDPLKKIADRKPITKKANLEPTGNLTENILRLCEGLKEIGLSKYAEELESTYVSYKKAENFHKTSKDKGEDLIDEAHPKGSHKLEGVDGDATIETIIDQQAEDIKIINKKPTGKLSSLEIINAVKISLADDIIDRDTLEEQLREKSKIIVSNLVKIHNITKDTLHANIIGYVAIIKGLVTNPTIDNLKKAKVELWLLKQRLTPGRFGPNIGTTSDAFSIVEPLLNNSGNLINEMINVRSKIIEIIKSEQTENRVGKTTVESEESIRLESGIRKAQSTLTYFKTKIETDTLLNNNDKKNATNWISNKLNLVSQVKARFESANENEKQDVSRALLSNINKILEDCKEFQKEWID